MNKSKFQEAIERGAASITRMGIEKRDKLEIYTILGTVAKSGASRIVSAFVIVDNMPICIARDVRVHAEGEDAGHRLAYDIFCEIHGLNGKWRYQDHLVQRWM